LSPELKPLLAATQEILAEVRHHLVTAPRDLPSDLTFDLEMARSALATLSDLLPPLLFAQRYQLRAAELAILRLLRTGSSEP
jgi:hypothetical protein